MKYPDLSNGEPTRKLPQGVVYGVVRRSDPNEQKEMVVYGWSTNQLKEEMNYIRDVSPLRMFACFVDTPFVASMRDSGVGSIDVNVIQAFWGNS